MFSVKVYRRITSLRYTPQVKGHGRLNSLRCKERFSIVCRKTKTKVITLTKHNAPIGLRKHIHVTSAKRGKTRASKARLVLVWIPIGCENGANIANQSQNAVSKTKANAFFF